MAPIYLAPKTSNRSYVHPLFRQRKIEGQAPGFLSEVPTFGLPTIREVAYGGYVGNIDAFLGATAVNAKVAVDAAFIGLPGYRDHDIILPSSPVVMTPDPSLDEGKRNMFLGAVGAYTTGGIWEKRGKTFVFKCDTVTHPERFLIGALRFGGITFSGNDEINYNGYEAITLLENIASLFLRTHTYPAFSSEDQFYDFSSQFPLPKKGSSYDTHRSLVPAFSAGRSSFATLTAHLSAATPDRTEIEALLREEERSCLKSTDVVAVAKPSPIPISYNVGGPGDIPTNFPGLVFPYFDGMIRGDFALLKDMLQTRFYRLLGPNEEGAKEKLTRILRGLTSAAGTPAMKILAHIFYGIRLALATQTRLFVVQTTDYHGFCLIGGQFSLYHLGRWLRPEEPEEFAQSCSLLSDRVSILRRIAEVLSTCVHKAGAHTDMETTIVITEEEINTSGKLWKACMDRVLSEEIKKELEPFLRLLTFDHTYTRLSKESVLKWIQRIHPVAAATSDFFDIEAPVYVPPTLRSLDNANLYELCKFGPDAPSLINAAGTRIPLTTSEGAVAKFREEGSTINTNLSEFLVHIKGVYASLADVNRMVAEKVAMMNWSERARGFRNIAISDDADIVMLCQALDAAVGMAQVTVEGRNSKRKRAEEAEERNVRRATGITDDMFLF